MTSKEIATFIYPDVKKSLEEYRGEGWVLIHTAARPFWFAITKLGVEIGVAISQPKVQPFLKYLEDVLPIIPDEYKKLYQGFLDLMTVKKEDFCNDVSKNGS